MTDEGSQDSREQKLSDDVVLCELVGAPFQASNALRNKWGHPNSAPFGTRVFSSKRSRVSNVLTPTANRTISHRTARQSLYLLLLMSRDVALSNGGGPWRYVPAVVPYRQPGK